MATYLIINLLFTLLLLPVVLVGKISLRAVLLTLLAVVLLTAIFDPIIVGLNIVSYDPSKILGVHIFGAPIEDFFYALTAAFLVPAIYRILERRRG